MKKDIEKIKMIQNSPIEEQETFLNQMLLSLKPTLYSYSFLPQVEKCIQKASYQALMDYQETTPILFSLYFSKKIHQTLLQEAEEFVQERRLPFDISLLRYASLILYPTKEKTYMNSIQITELFGAHKTVELSQKWQQTLKFDSTNLLRAFPNYKELLKKKKEYQKNALKKAHEKTVLNEKEEKYLLHYLGIHDDVCKDCDEIAVLEKTTAKSVELSLQSAFQKLESHEETKKNFLSDYPNCLEVYPIRMKKIYKAPKPTISKVLTKKNEPQTRPQIPTQKPKQQIPLNQETTSRETPSKISKIPKIDAYYPTLKLALQRSKDGTYPSIQVIAKKRGYSNGAISHQLKVIQQSIEQDPTLLEKLEKEIPNFEALWEDYLDSKTIGTFSKMQKEVMQLLYYQDEKGEKHERTNQEIAQLLSKKLPLTYTEKYVEMQRNKIGYKILNNPRLKNEVDELQDLLSMTSKEKEKKQEQKKKSQDEKIISFLKLQLQRKENGTYPSTKEVTQTMNCSKNELYNALNKIKKALEIDTSYKEMLKEEIPNFEALWEEFLDTKTKKDFTKRQREIIRLRYYKDTNGQIHHRTYQEIADILSQKFHLPYSREYVNLQINRLYPRIAKSKELALTLKEIEAEMDVNVPLKAKKNEKYYPEEKLIEFLTIQLKRTENGSYPSLGSTAKKLHTTSNRLNRLLKIIEEKQKEEDFHEKLSLLFPQFDALWEDFLDSKTIGTFSKRQREIIRLHYYKRENDRIYRRTNQEIATILSQKYGLSYNARYVQRQMTGIYNKLEKNKDLKMEVEKIQRDKDVIEGEEKNSKKEVFSSSLSKQEKNLRKIFPLIKEILKQDEDGFYPSKFALQKSLGISYTTLTRYLNLFPQFLKDEAILKQIEEEIPHVEKLWEDYIDSTASSLSEKDKKLISLLFYQDQDGRIKRRKNQEVAALLSDDIFHFSENYVDKETKRIYKLLKTESIKQKEILDVCPYFSYSSLLERAYQANEKRKSTIKEKGIESFKTFLTQDEHGFLPNMTDLKNQMGYPLLKKNSPLQFMKFYLENEENCKTLKEEIPNFEVLWNFALGEQQKGCLTPMQERILDLKNEKMEDGERLLRTNQEVAELLSENGLHFDEFYVQKNLYRISRFFSLHEKEKEEYLKSHPHYKIHLYNTKEANSKAIFSQQELSLLKNRYQTREKTGQFSFNEILLLEKLQDEKTRIQFQLQHPNLALDYYIYWNYQSIPKEEESTSSLKNFNLNTSYFQSILPFYNKAQEKALNFRLGYCDKMIHSTSETAKKSHLSQHEVETLISFSINETREVLQEKVIHPAYQKLKKESKKPLS